MANQKSFNKQFKRLAYFCLAIIVLITATACARYQTAKVQINGKIINVEIADTDEKRIKGLSNHANLNDDQGMLFIFNDKQIRNFWMKDMLYDLDIIWINGENIVKINKNLPKEGNKPSNIYSSAAPVDHVLEVNAGWAEANNVKVGDKVYYMN